MRMKKMGLKFKVQNRIDTGLCDSCEHLKKIVFDNGTTEVLCANLHAQIKAKVTQCSFFHLKLDDKIVEFQHAWDCYIDDDGNKRFYNPRVQQGRIRGVGKSRA